MRMLKSRMAKTSTHAACIQSHMCYMVLLKNNFWPSCWMLVRSFLPAWLVCLLFSRGQTHAHIVTHAHTSTLTYHRHRHTFSWHHLTDAFPQVPCDSPRLSLFRFCILQQHQDPIITHNDISLHRGTSEDLKFGKKCVLRYTMPQASICSPRFGGCRCHFHWRPHHIFTYTHGVLHAFSFLHETQIH